jgi:hypothetical protein
MDPNSQPTQQTPSTVPSPSQSSTTTPSSVSTATIITILLLFFMYPVGIIVMWFATKWPVWVKITLTCLLILFIAIMGILATILVAAINPQEQLRKANEAQKRNEQIKQENQKIINDVLSGTPSPAK